MLGAHSRLCNARSAVAPFAILSTHVRPLVRFLTLRTVFFPQQCQGHARTGQFAVDVRIVEFGILTGCLVLVWKEKMFQLGVGASSERGQVRFIPLAACCTALMMLLYSVKMALNSVQVSLSVRFLYPGFVSARLSAKQPNAKHNNYNADELHPLSIYQKDHSKNHNCPGICGTRRRCRGSFIALLSLGRHGFVNDSVDKTIDAFPFGLGVGLDLSLFAFCHLDFNTVIRLCVVFCSGSFLGV